MKIASRIADRLASLRFDVAEIAARYTLAAPDAARDLRIALDDAVREV